MRTDGGTWPDGGLLEAELLWEEAQLLMRTRSRA